MPKVRIIILENDVAKAVATAWMPTLQKDDVTLMYKVRLSTAEVVEVGFHQYEDMNNSYTAKKRVSTLFDTTQPLEYDDLVQFRNDMNDYEIWNWTSSNDAAAAKSNITSAMLSICDYIRDLIIPKIGDPTWIYDVKLVFTTGGKIQVNQLVSGVMSDVNELTLTSAAASGNWNATTPAEILDLIRFIVPGVKYNGFDPRRTRSVWLRKYPCDFQATRNTIEVMSAYAHIGNNLDGLNKNRTEEATAKRLLKEVESFDIKTVDKTKNGLTLPRLAIAFMDINIICRKNIFGDLQSQTDSDIDVVFQDVSLNGCPKIRAMNGYTQYNIEFSSYIYKKEKNVSLTDVNFLKSVKRFDKVSSSGYKSDKYIHDRVNKAISDPPVSGDIAFNTILASIRLSRSQTLEQI